MSQAELARFQAWLVAELRDRTGLRDRGVRDVGQVSLVEAVQEITETWDVGVDPDTGRYTANIPNRYARGANT